MPKDYFIYKKEIFLLKEKILHNINSFLLG
jgi:hypothetical protein